MNVRAVLVCHPEPQQSSSAEFTFWADVAEARRAEAELGHRCGPLCVEIHTIARLGLEPDPRRRATR
ncbi:hypothetical protein [Mycobacterium sp.]|uniref:hypothetical protein n=1 Tax=Mycobacterium sp. TaxID=1785 RepID=UPI003BB171FE